MGSNADDRADPATGRRRAGGDRHRSEAGAFDKVVVDAVVIVILVTCLMGPAISRYAGKKLVQQPGPVEKSVVDEPKKELS